MKALGCGFRSSYEDLYWVVAVILSWNHFCGFFASFLKKRVKTKVVVGLRGWPRVVLLHFILFLGEGELSWVQLL